MEGIFEHRGILLFRASQKFYRLTQDLSQATLVMCIFGKSEGWDECLSNNSWQQQQQRDVKQ